MSQSSTLAPSLTAFLQSAKQAGELLPDVEAAVLGLAEASINIAESAAQNGISQAPLEAVTGEKNADGDDQKALDVLADQLIAVSYTHLRAHET